MLINVRWIDELWLTTINLHYFILTNAYLFIGIRYICVIKFNYYLSCIAE